MRRFQFLQVRFASAAKKVAETKVSPPKLIVEIKNSKETTNMNLAVDKAHEGKSLKEVLKLRPSALQGIAEHSDAIFDQLKIRTIQDLAKWKYRRIAGAISVLASKEEEGGRIASSTLNIDKAVDKAFENMSFKQLLGQSPSILAGITKAKEELLEKLHLKTVGDIAQWKFADIADSIYTLSKFEDALDKTPKSRKALKAKKA